ncbi:MAG: hypothetical protein AB7R69_01360 [Candidatus Babeliales bacterium]
MNQSKKLDPEILHNILNQLCRDIETWLNPNPDGSFACSFDCCMGNSAFDFDDVLEEHPQEFADVIGITGIAMLKQLRATVDIVIWFDNNDSKKLAQNPGWQEICAFGQKVHKHIKDSLEAIETNTKILKKYPLSYTAELMNLVKQIASDNKNPSSRDSEGSPLHGLEDFLTRCWFVLQNPDDYKGITVSVYTNLENLYFLVKTYHENPLESADRSAKITQREGFLSKSISQLKWYEITQCAQQAWDAFEPDSRIFDRNKLIKRLQDLNIYVRRWGAAGPSALAQLERNLDHTFDDESRSFIEEIGNLDIGEYQIEFTRDKVKEIPTALKKVRSANSSDHILTIMYKKYGDSTSQEDCYSLHADGTIKRTPYQDPSRQKTYSSLSVLIESIIEEELTSQKK